MTTTFICGLPRTGKTLYLTMMGVFDYLAGRRIFANYPLHIPHTHIDIEDIAGIVDMEMEISPKTVLIQEASKWFDSRRSMRKENVLLSSFTGQSGKREIDIYYDDQFPKRIDAGLRDITDFTLLAHCIRDANKNPIIFNYQMFAGYLDAEINKTVRLPAPYMNQYYALYDTRMPTMPLERIKQLEKLTKETRGRKPLKGEPSDYMKKKYGNKPIIA